METSYTSPLLHDDVDRMPLPHATLYAPDKRNLLGPTIAATSFANAWATTERFFAQCTVAEPPDEVKLLYQPESTEDAGLAMIVERYGALTTPGRKSAGGMWHRPAEELADVATFVAGMEQAVGEIGPAQILFNRTFRWRDPSSGAAIPHQSATSRDGDAERGECPCSHVLVKMTPTSTHMTTHLHFPWAPDDPALDALLAALAPMLPFRIRRQFLFDEMPSEDGTRYRVRKAQVRREAK
jgi:hypothetical protein